MVSPLRMVSNCVWLPIVILGCGTEIQQDQQVTLPVGGNTPFPSIESCPTGANLIVSNDSETGFPTTVANGAVFAHEYRVYNTGTVACETPVDGMASGAIQVASSPAISPSTVAPPPGGAEYDVVTVYYAATGNGTAAIGLQTVKDGAYLISPSISVTGCPSGTLTTVNPFPGTGYIGADTPFYKQWAIANVGTVSCETVLVASATDSMYVPNPPGIWAPSTSVTVAPGDTVFIMGEYRSRGVGTGQVSLTATPGGTVSASVVVCGVEPC